MKEGLVPGYGMCVMIQQKLNQPAIFKATHLKLVMANMFLRKSQNLNFFKKYFNLKQNLT